MGKGSPPHTRGTLIVGFDITTLKRITPAYAGNTNSSCPNILLTWDHPRIRGEHFPLSVSLCIRSGSPPHTRGTPCSIMETLVVHGITPAYAGNTLYPVITIFFIQDHPRIRGEHNASELNSNTLSGSPPHTRGTPSDKLLKFHHRGITPAYAGNTHIINNKIVLCWDHPRIRGEHFISGYSLFNIKGSPPHTRGTPILFPASSTMFRITPAYAGNTLIAVTV